jgi:hypothetical protein
MNLLKKIGLASGLSLLSAVAYAIPISGTVDMSGTVFLNNALLGSATAATTFSGVTVGGIPTGSFTGTAGDSVTWMPFAWNPASTPVNPLWTYTDGGTGYTYSFSLASLAVEEQTNKFLNLTGVGTLSITGAGSPYDDTVGTWSFTISNSSGGAHSNFAFTFANSQTAVPDGGNTIALMGLALIGLVACARRRLL